MVTSVSASSSFIYVNGSSGNDSNDGLTWQTSKLTIKNATSTVSDHGSIDIADGIYTGYGNTNITISKSITINGQSRAGTILDGSNTNHVFSILNGFNVTINDVTLENARSDNGGAITSEGNLTLNNCDFINNSATHYGGAVGFDLGYLTVNNSNFYNNSAGYGGALGSISANSPLNMSLNNCYFFNNTANIGGAVFNTGYLLLNGCDLNANSATDGGAIYGETTLIISNSSFKNNHATKYGGALCYSSGTINLVNSVFNSNIADMNGGAMANLDGIHPVNMYINECSFTHNTAQNGGSIFNVGNLTVTNYSTFSFNSAKTSFGAIYNQGNTTLQNVQFFNNNCTMIGGAVGFDTGTLRASNCYFTDNSALNSGGAISSANQNLPSEMYLTQCTFNNNTAGMFGGAVFSTGNITITDSDFDSNNATHRGGAVSCEGGNLTVNNTIFSNNKSFQVGGAIESLPLQNTGTATQILKVNNCKFLSNSAPIGGAICSYEIIINLTQNLFLNNTASTEGGAIYGTNGTIQFNSFINNSAVNGKCIYIEQNSRVNADYNWWGTNLGPMGCCTGVNISKWMVLNLNANPSTLKSGQNSTIKLDVLHDNGLLTDPKHPDLYFHDPSLGCVPDELMNLTSTSGTIKPNLNMVNGTAQSILETDGVTNSNITISLDWDSLIFSINVKMDNIAPVVTSITPHNNTFTSNTKSPIKIVFSKPIQPGNFYGKIQLYHNSDVIPTNKLINSNILELIPLNNLPEGIYNVIIPDNSLIDSVGNNLENTFNSSFIVDISKPVVVYNNIKNGKISINSNKTIKLVFNKIIVLNNQQVYLKNSHGTSIPITIAIWNNTVSIKSNINLPGGNYTLQLNKGTFSDLYGSNTSSYTLNFTVDTSAPKVLYTIPSKNNSKASTTKPLTVKFSEPVKLSSNYITLKSSSGKVIKLKLTLKGNILTIDHNQLSKGTTYTLTLHTGSVKDLADNPVKLYTTKFTTDKK